MKWIDARIAEAGLSRAYPEDQSGWTSCEFAWALAQSVARDLYPDDAPWNYEHPVWRAYYEAGHASMRREALGPIFYVARAFGSPMGPLRQLPAQVMRLQRGLTVRIPEAGSRMAVVAVEPKVHHGFAAAACWNMRGPSRPPRPSVDEAAGRGRDGRAATARARPTPAASTGSRRACAPEPIPCCGPAPASSARPLAASPPPSPLAGLAVALVALGALAGSVTSAEHGHLREPPVGPAGPRHRGQAARGRLRHGHPQGRVAVGGVYPPPARPPREPEAQRLPAGRPRRADRPGAGWGAGAGEPDHRRRGALRGPRGLHPAL